MFKKDNPKSQIDQEQLEMITKAQKRIKQKKRLYSHFVIFLIGSVILILMNQVLRIGASTKLFDIDWFVYAIIIWLFFFLYHLFNVFITHKFLGKDWEKQQLELLVAKQKERIAQLQTKVEQDHSIAIKTETHPEKKTQIIKGLTLIVAAGEQNEIGKDNQLIWHLSDDLKRFKALTNEHHIIMGRKTFDSFPKPLPNRKHIVISRQDNYKVPEGVIVVNSLEDALNIAKFDKQPFIIGGGEIYKQAILRADKIELTRVHASFDADTFFPEIDTQIWKETSKIVHDKDENHPFAFTFLTYERR
jgi:dihydrofolate reductase